MEDGEAPGRRALRRRADGSIGYATRAVPASQLTDLETAERVLTRVSKTPPARRPTSAAAAEAKAPTATRGRGRPPKVATSKSAGREPNAPSLGERVLALAIGRTRRELYVACPNDRPNHVGMAVQRHLRAGRIQERNGKLYATSPVANAIA
jgi:AT hook motif